ncbi:hypothetical protein C8F04DRAFT_1391804 [Mycena alexandri]|uniref:Uncharacterized protein n=1 Tax=Mycena alexandri TaxID=1745969 RepID=A0AAD6T6H3_9AGAR|nr:hypothetical protein C8F04DRAFT_1391804 [Mycena alexandri]
MDPGSAPKRKITVVKVTEASPQRNYVNRSPSPYKSGFPPAPSPTFRPKAKVNSSATSNLATRKATSVVSSPSISRTPSVKSSVSSGAVRPATSSLTPRSGSPSKQQPAPPRPRAAITRGATANVRAGPQESRRRSMTTDANQPLASRSPASSSHPNVSELLDLSDDERPSPVTSPRITAKLSRRPSNEFPPSPPLAPNSSLRAQSHRPRVPSISSNASSSASGPFYSSSAAGTPTANPHRYSTGARASPTSSAGAYYQPFPRDDGSPKLAPRTNGFTAKVDPAAIPLPPHSPPTSAVSFSSRSSRSPSSVSHATESGTSQLSAPRPNGRDAADSSMRSGLENLMHFSGMLPTAEGAEDDDSEEDEDGQGPEKREGEFRASTFERKVKAEAKSVRKIADLEITNRSLLTINTSLEQTKHRQAKEIRELRRKLRESRLILPPRAFRAVKSSLEADDTADSDSDEEEEGDEAEQAAAEQAREAHDVMYRRIKTILAGLLETGRRALETTPQDFPEPVKVAKVLSAYELNEEGDADPDAEGTREGEAQRARPSPSHVAVPDSDGEENLSSEDEVEAMTLPRDSPPPSHPPSPHLPAIALVPPT